MEMLRLLGHLSKALRVTDRVHLKVWTVIFVLVSLQRTTALRPIVGTSEHWLPGGKRFFVSYGIENVFAYALPAAPR